MTVKKTHTATGPFDVKLAPQPLSEIATPANLGRLSIDKQFHGDLAATSVGEMLSAMGTVEGSAGYVAIERVTGTLHGRDGSFVLQHSATMNRGTPELIIQVVPDTGTDQLAGLSGLMKIINENGQHSYVFEYALA